MRLRHLALLFGLWAAGCSLSHNPDIPSINAGDGDGDFGDGDAGDGDLGDGDAGTGGSVGSGGGPLVIGTGGGDILLGGAGMGGQP